MKSKFNKIATLFVLALCASMANADQPLPSDEEMIKQGRDAIGKVGDLNSLMDKAQGTAATTRQQVIVPKESVPSTAQSPIYKELTKEFFDTAQQNTLTDKSKSGGSELLVFVSFSMPNALLASYSAQAKEAGATIVLRGMVEGSVTKTQLRAAPLDKEFAAWEINPGLFRKFNIKHVPAIVLADSRQAEIVEDGCAIPSSFIYIDGDLSIRQALLLMRSRGSGLMAKDAGKRLEKLER